MGKVTGFLQDLSLPSCYSILREVGVGLRERFTGFYVFYGNLIFTGFSDRNIYRI